MLSEHARTLESVISRAEIGRIQRCGQAELRLRLWQVGMGEAEAPAAATSTAMWLSRQALGHSPDPRALDKEVQVMVERFQQMTESERMAELSRIREELGLGPENERGATR